MSGSESGAAAGTEADWLEPLPREPYYAERARKAASPTSKDYEQPIVRVVEHMTGKELLRCRCRCRIDLSAVLAARLHVWPGERRLLLPGGAPWTHPELPAELEQLGWSEVVVVQLLRVPVTRNIWAPINDVQEFHRHAMLEMPGNFNTDAWCRNLGEPAGMLFVHFPKWRYLIGYSGIARALLLRRRMEELLPIVEYNPALVLQTMLKDKALWKLLTVVTDDPAEQFVRYLAEQGVQGLTDSHSAAP
jgi:hypothetical protein